MIYIIKHRPCITPFIKGYTDFGVGDLYKGKHRDINSLNPFLNETTALLDLLDKGDDIVGLVHYRRFFKDLDIDKARKILNDYDVITTIDYAPGTPYKHLTDNLDKALVDKYIVQLPEEVQKWFHEDHTFNLCSMFVSKREFLEKYCEWLFPIIIPLTEQFVREDVTCDIHRNRTLGFITECLFGYYCKDFKRYKNEIELRS